MTIRQRLDRNKLLIVLAYVAGFVEVIVAARLSRVVHADPRWLCALGFVLGTGAYLFGLRAFMCPACGDELPKTKTIWHLFPHLTRINPDFRVCPHCGVGLDSEMPEKPEQ